MSNICDFMNTEGYMTLMSTLKEIFREPFKIINVSLVISIDGTEVNEFDTGHVDDKVNYSHSIGPEMASGWSTY
jgi:hypothetical protein